MPTRKAAESINVPSVLVSLLQWGRVVADAEGVCGRRRHAVTGGGFNGAASLPTRKGGTRRGCPPGSP